MVPPRWPAAEVLFAARLVDAPPIGLVIAKDGYNAELLRATAVMEKRADGWYRAEYEADGTVISTGPPEGCRRCHRAGKDYVRSLP